ncbi:hypothetical protein MRB53_038926 [Persea americana]|nr:hypothetical protein MRB53_038926 [Persea americana]
MRQDESQRRRRKAARFWVAKAKPGAVHQHLSAKTTGERFHEFGPLGNRCIPHYTNMKVLQSKAAPLAPSGYYPCGLVIFADASSAQNPAVDDHSSQVEYEA